MGGLVEREKRGVRRLSLKQWDGKVACAVTVLELEDLRRGGKNIHDAYLCLTCLLPGSRSCLASRRGLRS